MTDDLISKQRSIDTLRKMQTYKLFAGDDMLLIDQAEAQTELMMLPSAQPETCEGCKHLGKWENEVEYGYPSPCTRCKRRVNDNYER